MGPTDVTIQADAARDSVNRTGGEWCVVVEGEVKAQHLSEDHARGIAALLGGHARRIATATL
jgi:hypothetical protein